MAHLSVIVPHLEQVLQSVAFFLRNEIFLKDTGEAKTLRDWLVQDGEIADLQVIIGFPTVLDQLNLPTLAIVPTVVRPSVDLAYNETMKEYNVPMTIFGFAGGYAEDHQNLRLQHRLVNDLMILLDQAEFFPIYGLASTGILDTTTELNQGEFRNVTARTIPQTGLAQSQRYRFAVDCEVSVIRARNA